jgi:methyl-accepting chemotaxis protein
MERGTNMRNSNEHGPDPDAGPPGADRRFTPRQLWIYGSLVLALLTVLGGMIGWRTLVRVEDGLERMSTAWATADGMMEINIGGLKYHWAVNLAEHGMAMEAERARQEAVGTFRTQLERVRQANLMAPEELRAAERLFSDLETFSRQQMDAPPGPPDPDLQRRIAKAQSELDALLVKLESRGDDLMEEELVRTRHTVRHAVMGIGGLVLAVSLTSVVIGALVLRWLLRWLENPVHRITRSTDQLREATQYQVRSAAEQSSATVQISSTMQELLASYRNMTQKSRDMVQTSKMAAEECHKGHTFLTQSQKGIGHIKVEVGRIADHMRTLEEKSRQINSVLEIINEMASQTNLLSINATIEAAGAGEAGRRFAVVAEEIRLLAERAVESTEEIRTLIEDIQETVQVTNSVTADGERAVDRGLEDVGKIAENFDTLLSLVTQTADAVQLIEAAAQEQGRSVQQVTDAVESLSHISSETERHSGDTLETVKNLALTARELESMASLRSEGKV